MKAQGDAGQDVVMVGKLSDPVVELDTAPRARALPAGGAGAWATLGVAWTIFVVVGYVRWIVSDDFDDVPTGVDEMSTFHQITLHGYEAFAMLLLAWLVYWYIIRPWRATGKLSLDGMLLIGCAVAFFLDPVINYFHNDTFAWNNYAVNFGSWGGSWPGSDVSHNYAEGLLWAAPDYIYFGLLGGIFGCYVLRQLQKRRPNTSLAGGLTVVYLLFFLITTVVEIVRIRLEMYGYARAWSGLTLWDGKQYQWPVYETLFASFEAVAFAYLRWSWLTTGRSFLDRGIERFPEAGRRRELVMLFAVIGFSLVVFAFAYFIPWAWTSVEADAIADLPSYMRPGGN